MEKGIYKHFKGELYIVVDLAMHSESEEQYVIYHNINNKDKLWIRPINMFNDLIENEKLKIKRFEFLGNE